MKEWGYIDAERIEDALDRQMIIHEFDDNNEAVVRRRTREHIRRLIDTENNS